MTFRRVGPLCFYYHGTGGQPTTRLIRAHTGKKDWIVVGMAYAQRGTFQLTPAGMDEEIRVMKEVRGPTAAESRFGSGTHLRGGFQQRGWVSWAFAAERAKFGWGGDFGRRAPVSVRNGAQTVCQKIFRFSCRSRTIGWQLSLRAQGVGLLSGNWEQRWRWRLGVESDTVFPKSGPLG